MGTDSTSRRTALYQLHVDAGAKIVPFAGYDMPVSYPAGIMQEHQHTRSQAGLFDVSHMGQIAVKGDNAAALLETLMPVDIVGLAPGRQRYGLFTNEAGGVLDDLMVICKGENEYVLVVNAACKENDLAHLQKNLGSMLQITMLEDRSLLALQGPESDAVLTRLGADTAGMKFMDARELIVSGIKCFATRSGYTGEDGYELSIPTADAENLASNLLGDDAVEWVGLGARDSLRLEAGLSLYGHELNTDTTPIEAGLSWAISKSRRLGGDREGGFPGAQVILPQVPRNVDRILVPLLPQGRAPVREDVEIQDRSGNKIGTVTSGGYAPTLGKPVCLALVDVAHSAEDTELVAMVRNKALPVIVSKLPFVPHRYCR